MDDTWKSTVAGVLDLVAGVMNVIGAAVLACLAILVATVGAGAVHEAPQWPFMAGFALFCGLSLLSLVFGLVAVAGGIRALTRRSWGWALAGSIAALFCCLPLGIPALILTILAQPEFEQ